MEKADLETEKQELKDFPRQEHQELAAIYVNRGLSAGLADQVATQLMQHHDVLGVHARDEIGIAKSTVAKPLQAALASTLSFTMGVAPVLIVIWLAPQGFLLPAVIVAVLIFLALLGALGAWTGGANIRKGTLRALFWGALALAATGGEGALLGHL